MGVFRWLFGLRCQKGTVLTEKGEANAIDADALTRKFKTERGGLWAMYVVDSMPTVDAVRVVRCVDCKHRDAENGLCKGRGWPMQLVPDDGFCDKVERREEDE